MEIISSFQFLDKKQMPTSLCRMHYLFITEAVISTYVSSSIYCIFMGYYLYNELVHHYVWSRILLFFSRPRILTHPSHFQLYHSNFRLINFYNRQLLSIYISFFPCQSEKTKQCWSIDTIDFTELLKQTKKIILFTVCMCVVCEFKVDDTPNGRSPRKDWFSPLCVMI